jgi:hypothetical protein
LTYTIQNELLSLQDLMRTESEILIYLQTIRDEQILLFEEFYRKVQLKKVSSLDKYDIFQKKKTRLIDPIVKIGTQLSPTSNYSEKAKLANNNAKQKSHQGIYLSISLSSQN